MSNIVDENIRKFWDHNHRKGNITWLARPNIIEVYNQHGIYDIIHRSKRLKVMEIGVGVAESIKYLSILHEAISVDISPKALEKVKGISKGYLTQEMPNIEDNSIDLAFSNLVIPHCDEDMVCFIIPQTMRIIKNSGFFSMHSGYCRKPYPGMYEECYQNGIRINFLDRDEKEIMRLIDKSGGEVFNRPRTLNFEKRNMTWNYFHIRKKGANV